MRNNSNAKADKMPNFKTEAEEAEWYHSPAGIKWSERRLENAAKKGTLKRTHFEVKKTDPAVLETIVDRVKAKQEASKTISISIRIQASDKAKAEAIAKQHGIGYQTLLKEIIHEKLESLPSA